MSIKIGGIDLTNVLINAELRIGVLEKIVEAFLSQYGQGVLSQEDIEKFREETLKEIQNKYPDAGIKKL